MYRKSSGGTGFSFRRLVTNAVPNFANDTPEQDADLSDAEKDILWIHQVLGAEAAKRTPMTLDEGSALKAGVTSMLSTILPILPCLIPKEKSRLRVEQISLRYTLLTKVSASEKISSRIHKSLVQNGVLTTAHPLGLDTNKITSKFAHQLSFISVAAQRKVVGMLFFWEQEAIRWRLLEQEKAKIEDQLAGIKEGKGIAQGQQEDVRRAMEFELGAKLQRMKVVMEQKPSQRAEVEQGQAVQQGEAEAAAGPPKYEPQA